MRLVHISDLHFWHITLNPAKLAGKRLLGMMNLVLNRAWKYRMQSMPALIAHVLELQPDHVLITGDLTTTALEQEFRAVRAALAPLKPAAASLSILPGNHDRYTRGSTGLFERYFAELGQSREFPWVKQIDGRTSIIALDASHPNPLSARGTITPEQLHAARSLLEKSQAGGRPVVACHYPVFVPQGTAAKSGHDLRGTGHLREFLRSLAPNIYCHGHVHKPWAFRPAVLPTTLCVNPGAALKHSRTGVQARLLEIVLDGDGVQIRQHRLRKSGWEQEVLADIPGFFHV